MKILITGPTGFIGKHLIKRLVPFHSLVALEKQGADISFLKNNGIPFYYTNESIVQLISIFEKEKFDGIIHLASLFLIEHKNEHIKQLVDSNIFFGTELLESAVQTNVKWFVNTGTFWQHYHSDNYNPVNLYAATKQAFQDMAAFYTDTSALNFVTLKLNDTFGPEDTRPKLFNLWMKNIDSGEEIEMSAGEQIIDISYIDNVIDAFEQLVTLVSEDKELTFCNRSFGVSSGNRMTLRQLANLFEEVTNKKLSIKWGGRQYRDREVMEPWASFEPVPGWMPRKTIEQGIIEYLRNS